MIKDRPANRPALLVLLRILVAVALLLVAYGARAEEAPVLEARVSKILDKDIFTLSGESRRIRIRGLDAPEWDQRGGSAATATLRGMISGKRLRCAVLDIDRYSRLVAQCFLPDGRDIAAEMIRSGAATEYVAIPTASMVRVDGTRQEVNQLPVPVAAG